MSESQDRPGSRSMLSDADLARAREIAAAAPPIPPEARERLRLLLSAALPPATPARRPKKGESNDAA
ncbi:MAG: hypothetical protein ACYCVZ_05200 [Streptosporangiaceae bacterium]